MKHVAVCVLTSLGKYLLQLRDVKPGIADSGMWGLFGGHIEAGESPEDAIRREVLEETGMTITPRALGDFTRAESLTERPSEHVHVFCADVSGHRVQCKEGQAAKLFWNSELGDLSMSWTTKTCIFLQQYKVRERRDDVVMCHGVFDVLHYGHVKHLESARSKGQYLIVSLVADRFVQKGAGRPVFNEGERAVMLSSLRAVDKVVMTDSIGPFDHLKMFRPATYERGPDYVGVDFPEKSFAERLGVRLTFTDCQKDIGSSRIIELLKEIE